jgi:myo-inositol-1(or 4)-monophosphatase
MKALDKRLNTAIEIATAAGELAVRMRSAYNLKARLKSQHDWLTEADLAVERLISERLATVYPEDGFQGEESGFTRSGTLKWVVDPIDGTANYVRGDPRFCVSLGLIEDKEPLLGVVVSPVLNETFTAYRGNGAMLNGKTIRVSDTTDIAYATVEFGLPLPLITSFSIFERIIRFGANPRYWGCAAMGLADVAAGRLDAYVSSEVKLWDVAAMLVILSEAGGSVNRFMDSGSVCGPILGCAPGLAQTLSTFLS